MEILFRKAGEADIAGIAHLWHAGWHDGHAAVVPDALVALRTPESFADRTRAHLAGMRVALLGDQLAGFFLLKGNELNQFYVAADARGRGVAQAMMGEAMRVLRAAGVERAWLYCAPGNARAERFYARCGWENMGQETVGFETSAGPFELPVIRFERALD
ncbi:MAG: GNAT family N-acetyltransferase [Pseudomonadota bacterium]